MTRVPASAWRYVGEAPSPGEMAPVEGGGLGPLVLIGVDEGVRCLSNVCTHRGALLVEAASTGRGRLRCRYHGRCFTRAGVVTSAPGFEVLPDEPLTSLAVGRWGSAVFAAHEPTVAFSDWMPAEASAPLTASREYRVAAPWPLYMENYLEGLHVPFAHPGLNAALDQSTYHTEVRSTAVLQTCEDVRWWCLFPTTLLNVYSWGVSLNVVEAIDSETTRVRYLTYGSPPEGWGVDQHATELEDQSVVESVAVGLRSPLYRPGRLSPDREAGVAGFRRWMCDATAG